MCFSLSGVAQHASQQCNGPCVLQFAEMEGRDVRGRQGRGVCCAKKYFKNSTFYVCRNGYQLIWSHPRYFFWHLNSCTSLEDVEFFGGELMVI